MSFTAFMALVDAYPQIAHRMVCLLTPVWHSA